MHKEEGRKGRSKWEEEFYFSLNIFVLQQVAASGTRRGDFFGYSHVSLGPAVPDKQSKLLLLLVVGLEWFFECYFFFFAAAHERQKNIACWTVLVWLPPATRFDMSGWRNGRREGVSLGGRSANCGRKPSSLLTPPRWSLTGRGRELAKVEVAPFPPLLSPLSLWEERGRKSTMHSKLVDSHCWAGAVAGRMSFRRGPLRHRPPE